MSDDLTSPSESAPPESGQPGRFRGAARLPIVAALAAALLLGGLIDRAGSPAPTSTVPASTGPASTGPASTGPASTGGAPAGGAAMAAAGQPVAAPPLALSSSWFCAGATDVHRGGQADRGEAPGALVIANSGLATATGVVTLVPSQGPPVRRPVSVGPDSRATVAEDVPRGTPWIGAIVDINAGAVAVSQLIDGSAGRSATPCATAGSAQWYFPTGATLINAGEVLSLLNPYPTDAVVDLSFTTDQGLEQPQEFQGLVVAPDQLLTVNLGAHLRRRQAIATTVTARSGRLVAWETEVVTAPTSQEAILGTPAASASFADPAAPVAGLTVTLGAPTPALTWTWADGEAGNGVNETYVIYNPGAGSAELKLSVTLDQGVAEPFDLSVGPEQVITVVSTQEVRIPPGVGHAAVLESLNGVPVVAERTVAAAAPSAWSGLGALLGSQLTAARWLLAANGADAKHDGVVVVYNPGRTAAETSLAGLSGQAQVPLVTVTVGGGRRVAIHLNSLRASLDEPLVVSASTPVYVESDFYGQSGTPGLSLSFGVPLSP